MDRRPAMVGGLEPRRSLEEELESEAGGGGGVIAKDAAGRAAESSEGSDPILEESGRYSGRGSPGPANDSRSVHVQQMLAKEWKERVSGLTIPQQIQWLRSAEGHIALGPKQAESIARALLRRSDRVLSIVCSWPWWEAFQRGETFPPIGMILSRNHIRVGVNGTPHRRYTPPVAVRLEDQLDDMDAPRAGRYRFPPSCSARAIDQIQMLRLRPKKRRLKVVSDKKLRRMQRQERGEHFERRAREIIAGR